MTDSEKVISRNLFKNAWISRFYSFFAGHNGQKEIISSGLGPKIQTGPKNDGQTLADLLSNAGNKG